MENYTNKVEKMGVIYYFNHKEQIHRLDGPAIVWADGSEHWYMNGKRNRENGQAIIASNYKHKEWILCGKYHRLDGPAVETSRLDRNTGELVIVNHWCLNDMLYPKSNHNRLVLFSYLEPRRIGINPMEE
jgi:hypothetical protein